MNKLRSGSNAWGKGNEPPHSPGNCSRRLGRRHALYVGGRYPKFRDRRSHSRRASVRLPIDYRRPRLRPCASELNRFYFDRWGYAQVLLALLGVALAWKGGRRLRAAILVAAVIAVGLQFYVVPETIRIGRSIDFQPREPETARQAEFWRLHNAYTGLDMLKFLIIAGCGIALLRERD